MSCGRRPRLLLLSCGSRGQTRLGGVATRARRGRLARALCDALSTLGHDDDLVREIPIARKGREVQGKETEKMTSAADLLSRILVTDPKGGNGGQAGRSPTASF